jgi:hypothetical protein
MSTKGTLAWADTFTTVGRKTFRQNIHVYREAFDKAPYPVYIELWQQGVFGNQTMTMRLPRKAVLKLVDDLAKWARETREWERQSKRKEQQR